MRFGPLLLLLCLMCPAIAGAQGVAAPPAAPDPASPPSVVSDDDWRSTDGYPFPALAKTVADMQNLAYAMTLRDYCSDRRVPDPFVREQLARFSRLTGREENCRSLLDY